MQNVTARPFPADGSPLTCDAGSYKIMLIPTVDGGYTMKVMAGGHEYTELGQGFRDERMARNAARSLTAGLRAGISIHQFIGDRIAAEQDLIAAVNKTMDEATDTHLAERRGGREIAAEVMADADPNWKAKLRAEVVQAAKQANSRTAVPTASRVHTKPLTAVELDRVRNHDDGVVTCLPGQSWLVLRAIWRRIGGQPTYRPGTRIIASLTLNAAQLAGVDINSNGVAA